jgi:hypothetical protein
LKPLNANEFGASPITMTEIGALRQAKSPVGARTPHVMFATVPPECPEMIVAGVVEAHRRRTGS